MIQKRLVTACKQDWEYKTSKQSPWAAKALAVENKDTINGAWLFPVIVLSAMFWGILIYAVSA